MNPTTPAPSSAIPAFVVHPQYTPQTAAGTGPRAAGGYPTVFNAGPRPVFAQHQHQHHHQHQHQALPPGVPTVQAHAQQTGLQEPSYAWPHQHQHQHQAHQVHQVLPHGPQLGGSPAHVASLPPATPGVNVVARAPTQQEQYAAAAQQWGRQRQQNPRAAKKSKDDSSFCLGFCCSASSSDEDYDDGDGNEARISRKMQGQIARLAVETVLEVVVDSD